MLTQYRYIFCRGLRAKGAVEDYMRTVNDKLQTLSANQEKELDVMGVVPLDVMKDDTAFNKYLVNSNTRSVVI